MRRRLQATGTMKREDGNVRGDFNWGKGRLTQREMEEGEINKTKYAWKSHRETLFHKLIENIHTDIKYQNNLSSVTEVKAMLLSRLAIKPQCPASAIFFHYMYLDIATQ